MLRRRRSDARAVAERVLRELAREREEVARERAEIDRERGAMERQQAEMDRQRTEIELLRAENRALVNSLLGTAGIPPIEALAAHPAQAAPVRRRSWPQVAAAREIAAGRAGRKADSSTAPADGGLRSE